ALPRLRPLLDALIDEALSNLDQGRAYTLAVPRREARLRLASLWPLLIGLGTLARLRRAENLLDPTVVIKMPRAERRGLRPPSFARGGPDRGLAAWARGLALAASRR